VPEGENRDDLFEDLDKFFAPIQDVDWPETKPPANRPATEDERDEPAATAPLDDEIRVPEPDEADRRDEGPTPDVSAEGHEEREWDEVPDEPDPSSLLETSGVADDETSDVSVEGLTQPPSAYVDLPGADDVEAELDEPALDEPPSAEAVEAAVDHFAESVRDEVDTESHAQPGAYVTDPVGPGTFEDDLAPEERSSSMRTVRVGGGAQGLGGPSWQEPSTMEVGAPDEQRSGGRDVPAAFLTGLVLAAGAIGTMAIGQAAFAAYVGFIVVWAQGELYRALQKQHHQPATALGLVSGGLILAAAYFRGEAAMLSIFALSIIATFVWYMATPASHRRGTNANVAFTVLGIAYVPLLAGYALVLLDERDGPALVVTVIALTFAYDTAAFVIGSWMGSRPLAPMISPKKSVEGALGATLVVILLAGGAVSAAVDTLNTLDRSIGLAVVISVFAPLGDLAESLLKRDLGVKDMGSVLPGHGGVLDRIDSLLFVVPAAFMFLRLILS
jgi:phosphatidate cytidylyltransferase